MKLKATLTALPAFICALVFGQTNNNYLMNASLTSVNSCTGFFMDSGGGNSSYGPNQHFTTTICPSGTGGTHVQLVFSGTQLGTGDELCFFDGQNAMAPSLGCASDFGSNASFIIQATAVNTSGCLTITFNSDASDQGNGWSADMNCIPACQTILAVLDSTTPPVLPVDTGWIDICPGDRVFFWGKGSYPQNGSVYSHSDLTSDFEWDFGDGTITFGPNVSHTFDEPGGYVVQLEIKDQLGCKNTNFISQRVRVAPRPHFALGDWPIQICSGDTIHLNAMVDSSDQMHTVSVMPAEAGFQTLGVRSDSLPLPDGNGSSYQTTITFTDFSPGQILTNINDLLGIWVNMEHSWMRDLQIKLTCPNGQTAILHNHPGQTGGEVFLGVPYEADEGFPVPIPGTGWDYGWAPDPDYNYTWITYANTFLPDALPSGSFNSHQPLSNFLGCPLNGDWTIQVTDLWPIDNGYIFSWSIDFDPGLYPQIEMFSPALNAWEWKQHPSIYYSTADSISGTPVNAGEVAYTFTVHDEFGCAWDTTVDIQVLPLTHPDCHSCSEIIKSAPDSTICKGEPVMMDVSMPVQASDQVTFESYDDYPIGAGNHPPASPYNSVIQVNSIFPATITNVTSDIVSVCIDLKTDFDADIQLFLRAPNNQLLMLSTNNGGSGDNYTQTCFTPTATVPITTAAAPFTGNFQPEGAWNVLNGSPINGNWTLRVSDAFGLNAMGNLNWWSITFNSKNNVTYTWTPNNGLSCNNCPNPVATPQANTSYIVSAQDNYGCISKDTVSLTVLNSFVAPVVTCEGQPGGEVLIHWTDIAPGVPYEININGTGWQTPNNGNLSHLVTGLVNGNSVDVQVRVNVNGAACQVAIGESLYQYLFCPIDAQTSTPGPFAVSCHNLCDESVDITVNNGVPPYSFTVTNQTTGDQFTQNNATLANLCPGAYQVIVQELTNGCLDTVTFNVNDQPAIVVTAMQVSSVSCHNGSDGCASVSATGGVGGFTYIWDNPNMSTGANICTLPAGSISVTAMDINGCEGTGSVNITQPPAIDLAISKTDVKCLGGMTGTASVLPTGGTGPFTYQWSGGTTPDQQTAQGLSAGTYSLTVTDSKGCEAFGSVTIGEPANGVTVVATQSVIGCFGENLSEAQALATGGSGTYTYLWTPSNQTGQTATNLMPSTYTVVATDANGCTATDMIDITQWNPINISISFVPPTCHGAADGEMAANIVTGGNGTYTYKWNNGVSNDYIEGLQGGLTYTVTVTDGQGCTGMLSRFLEDPMPIQVNFSTVDANCFNSEDGAATVTGILNATLPVTYQWDAAALNQTTPTADSLAAGTYTVIVTDVKGCTATGITEIEEPAPIKPTFTATNNKCFGDSQGMIDLAITGGVGGYNIAWSNGETTQNITGLNAGNYYVTITDSNGCEKTDSAVVLEPVRMVADLTVKDVSCNGDRDGSITIAMTGGTPPFTYSLDGDKFYGSSTLIALKAGDYSVTIKDVKGCLHTTETTVHEPPALSVDILVYGLSLDEHMINYGDSIPIEADVMNAQGNVMITWSAAWCGTLFANGVSDCDETPMNKSLWAKPDYTNDYFVLVVDDKGCEAEDHLQVHVKKERRVLVPTGFSPNGDGMNDLLPVHGKAGTMIKLFQVFDRWGELMFQDIDIPINDTTRGWDGTFKSKDMPPGVYVWYLEAEYEDGMKDSFKGETTLIR